MISKSMTREWGEKLLIYRGFRVPSGRADYKSEPCEKCGGFIAAGDWPFCRGSAADHER